LHDLKNIIEEKVTNNPLNKKILIFTAFADTAHYLYSNLSAWISEHLGLHSAMVTGSSCSTTLGKSDYNSILVNFSPLSKNRARLPGSETDEISILIATDCISEGQNLQDCDTLINYDIHWNPVRIIQRFGRIDRLGSKNKTIQLVNFWPTKDLDHYINLKDRVESRMALVDLTATGEDNILNTEQIEDFITEDLKYRNRQLRKLIDEVLDLEDVAETVSLSDFSLDCFRNDLLSFLERNKTLLKDSPNGLYAIVPSPIGEYGHLANNVSQKSYDVDIVRPGVIFCLASKHSDDTISSVNPLGSYFLVYIREDGTVRYNYTHAKQILDIFRLLCQGIREPYEELCTLFNAETNNGENMSKYTQLLHKVAKEIILLYKKKGAINLTTDRAAILEPLVSKLNTLGDFELITWLIVR